MKAPLWQWQSYFVLEFLNDLPLYDKFTYWEAEEMIAHWMYDEALFPLMLQVSKPLEEYLQLLCTVKILKKSRSEEHTSELQSRFDIVCRLLLEKKKR